MNRSKAKLKAKIPAAGMSAAQQQKRKQLEEDGKYALELQKRLDRESGSPAARGKKNVFSKYQSKGKGTYGRQV